MQRFTKERYIGSDGIVARERKICGEYLTHRHEFFEIEYIISGTGEYRIDDRVYEIKSGMLFFMTPFHFHSVSASECRIYNVMFTEEHCDPNFLIHILHSDTSPALDTTGDDSAYWHSILRELSCGEKSSSYTDYLLNALLGKLASLQSATASVGAPVKNAILYLMHRFRENPSLAQAADYVGYTPSYFSAIFKQEIGIGYKEYLDHLRFAYAKKLIQHSKMPVIQVCRECGFDDYPNFVRRFKARFGASPKELRESI